MTKSPYKLTKGEIILELTNLNVSFDQKASMRELRNLLVKAQKNNEKTKKVSKGSRARYKRRVKFDSPRNVEGYNPNGNPVSLDDLYYETLMDTERVVVTANKIEDNQSGYGYIGVVSGHNYSHQGAFKLGEPADIPKVILDNLKRQYYTAPKHISVNQPLKYNGNFRDNGTPDYSVEIVEGYVDKNSITPKYTISTVNTYNN
jgi:hypothetical protein